MKKTLLLLAAVLLFSGCEPIDPIGAPRDTTSTTPAASVPEETNPQEAELFVPEETTTAPAVTSPADAAPLVNSPGLVEAPSAILYDLTNSKLLYAKNPDDKIYPASMTKLLTALVAYENAGEDFVFTVGDEIGLIQPGSSIALLARGQRLGLEAMLCALLVPSGNDAAYTIAANIARADAGTERSDGETVDYFVGMMNTYAKSLGCTGSSFANPDGYHNERHYSTARDILRISIAASENALVRDICSRDSTRVVYETGEVATWSSSNYLLSAVGEATVTGLKTGFTEEAGYCLAGLAEVGGTWYISVVAGCDSAELRDLDTVRLLTYAVEGFPEGVLEAVAE